MADLALMTAIDVLEATICECGHFEGEHSTDLSKPYDVAECRQDGCDCSEFRPVEFAVTRRDGRVR